MKLPPEAIAELNELYQKKFGISLSQEELAMEGRDLLELVDFSKGGSNKA